VKAARLRLGAMLALALVAVLAGAVHQAGAVSTSLVISQVYGGGGNAGAPLRNDYIELFNRGGTDVVVTGWSVQYAATTGSNWQKTDLTGTVPAGGYLLVQEAAGANTAAPPLPPPDATGTIPMAATAGKVVLRNNATLITAGTVCPTDAATVDLVGFGTGTNCFEGSGPTPAPSNTLADLRAEGGCTDTDSNAGDFATGAPAPRNSQTTPDPCLKPGIIATATPHDQAAGGDVTLTAAVTGATHPPSTGLGVVCDVSWAGLGGSAQLYDDGSHGDATSGDNTFSLRFTIPSATSPGERMGTCTVSDAQGRSASGPYTVKVLEATADVTPTLSSHTPDADAADVPVDSSIGLTFSEPVDVTGSWYSISCTTSGAHDAVVTGGPGSYLLNPNTDFAHAETCTVALDGSLISDQDTNDPPDTLAGTPSWSFTTAAAVTPPLVVLSEVYGGGGNNLASHRNDFIELYNRGSSQVPLGGWSVQYASAAGTTWQVTSLPAFSLQPGQHFLIQEASGGTAGVLLPIPDATGTINMSATTGKVALVNSTTALTSCTAPTVVDLVGYGASPSCFEGSGPAPAGSNTTSIQRNGGGSIDTGNNAADFSAATPTPQASADQPPAVATTTPANGATGVAGDTNLTITFNEAVDVSGSWFTIECGSSGSHAAAVTGGPTSFTLDPAVNFAGNESCTVTVVAANVTDQDANDPPNAMAENYVFTFQVADTFACGDAATAIDVIQGSGLASARVGQSVTVEGVVVGDYQLTPSEFNGFYLQEQTADADTDPATSEGIFVFGGGVDVNRGDIVRVRGTVTEFSGLTELSPVSAVTVCPGTATVPATHVALPVPAITDLERYEGMLVDFEQTLTVTEVFNLGRFGEVSLSGAGRLFTPTAVAAPGAPAQAVEANNNRSRIILDDGNNQQNIDPTRYPQSGLSAANTLRVGDTLPGLTGVMDFRFSNYRIQPIGPISFDHTNPRTAAPAAVGGNLKVASFNVLNYFNGDGVGGGFPTARGANTPQEFARQRAKEISALKAMNADIVGLMEMENDAPPNSAVEDLVAGLNDAMGAGTYSFINTGVIGTDAIKVALIYKPGSVTPVGAYKLMTSAVDPRFVDTLNRPSLAQTFQQNATGGKLTIVVNHLKSKSSACAGDPDTGDGQGDCNLTRTRAAAALADWLKTDPTGSGDPDFLLIGDMNAYAFEDPITAFTNGGLRNVVRERDGLTAYSYVFDGESGYLDHALATPSLAGQITGVDHWHINPDEPTVLDYNTEFKTANQVNTFYDPGPYRSSDHDPVVIGLLFNSAPTADVGGPYTVQEGGSVSVSASGTDADGDTLSYAWDLDDNGSFETSGQTATFSAATIDGPASRTIHVRVSDGSSSTIDDAVVNITNVPPTATFNAPASVFAGSSFTLSLTSPSDPAPADTFQYAFDCGSGFGAFGSASTTTCATSDTGVRNVGGRIRDDDGDMTEYHATVNVVVTFTSLCDLVKRVVSDPGVAQGLCDKLTAASAAAARGNTSSKQSQLQAFRNQVDAQVGKSISAADAELLKRLSNRL
jgi:uncharacterized protein